MTLRVQARASPRSESFPRACLPVSADSASDRVTWAVAHGRVSVHTTCPVWNDIAQIVAVCDVDDRQVEESAHALVNSHYSSKLGQTWSGVVHQDYHDLLHDADEVVQPCVSRSPTSWARLHRHPSARPARTSPPEGFTFTFTHAEEGPRRCRVPRSSRSPRWQPDKVSPRLVYGPEPCASRHMQHLATVQNGHPGDPAAEPTTCRAWQPSTSEVTTTPYVCLAESRSIRRSLRPPVWFRCKRFGADDHRLGLAPTWTSSRWAVDAERAGPMKIYEARRDFPLQGSGTSAPLPVKVLSKSTLR